MSRSKAFLALVFFFGGAAALWFGRREITREETDPSLRAMRDLGAIQMAIEKYRIDAGVYPTGHDGLGALIHRPYSVTSRVWRGPYMDLKQGRGLRDPWGRPYAYQVVPDGRGTALTLGADGRPGGTGPDQDLYGASPGDARTAPRPSR